MTDTENPHGIVKQHIPEIVVPGKRLGRHIHTDNRSTQFPAPLAPKVVSVMHPTNGLPLNQGSIGSCTANALIGSLNTGPNFAGKLYTESDAVQLYSAETTLEGDPYPPNDPGGSGIMVCTAAKNMGLISSYAHTFNLQHSLMALTLRPVITGVSWFDSFDTPDENGLVEIAPDATVRGGHEIVAIGIDIPNRLVWLMNSWGPSFGVGGKFCWSFDTWEQLLTSANGGDVTVPLV